MFKSWKNRKEANDIVGQMLLKVRESLSDEDDEFETDEPELVTTSVDVQDTLDAEGNVTGSVVKKHEEITHESQDIADLKAMVAVKNDLNEQHHSMIEAGLKVAGSIVCVGAMLFFERSHAITSKSLSFMPKPKL